MPHALVTGDPRRHAQIRLRLEMLGLTAAVADPVSGCDATVGACDLLVHAATARHADVPRRGAGELPDAPILCVGAPRPEAWLHVSWSELEGERFARAVRDCVELARTLRQAPPADDGALRYRELLAHELRSPLAVVATALQALESEVRGPGSRGMVACARRNLGRLERTVDWNHRFLALAVPEPLRATAVVDPDDLAERLAREGVATRCDGDAVLETDPELVTAVVLQMVRACQCLAPEVPVRVTLAARDDVLCVGARPDGGVEAAPRVSRHGLAGSGATAPDALAGLVRLLVPAAALDSLGARLHEAPDGTPELHLPARAAAPTA